MATLDAPSLVEAISDAIEEILQSAPEAGPGLDQHYGRLRTSTMGVEKSGTGRDFKVVHPIKTGISAPFQWSTNVLGADPRDGLNQAVHALPANYTAYPGLAYSSWQGTIRREVQLARGQGTIFIPVEIAKANSLSATVYDEFKKTVRAHAKGIMLGEIQAYYRRTLGSNSVEGIGTVSGAPTNPTTDVAVFVLADGAVRNIHPGMFLDFYNDAASPAKQNDAPCIVDSVRYLPDTANDTGGYGEVTVKSTDGTDITTEIADTDIVVLANSQNGTTNNGPRGPESWLLTTGSVFNIDVDTYQQFQSVSIDVAGPFTTPVGLKAMGRFFKGYGPEDMPDTFVTSQGVTGAALENLEGMSTFPRMGGQPLTFGEGYKMGQVPFTFGSMNVMWEASAFMPSGSDVTAANPQGGRLWGLKTRENNIVRYAPPRSQFAGGGGGLPDVPQEVEFLASNGNQGVFLPWPDGAGSYLPIYGAPYDHWMAVAPQVMQGILLTSLSELL